MPAFTFEKISSRDQRGSRTSIPQQNQQQPVSPQPERRNGVIQVLGRFVEARAERVSATDRLPPRQK